MVVENNLTDGDAEERGIGIEDEMELAAVLTEREMKQTSEGGIRMHTQLDFWFWWCWDGLEVEVKVLDTRELTTLEVSIIRKVLLDLWILDKNREKGCEEIQ